MKTRYESDDATFSADAYTARGWAQGIAWRVFGWEVEPDEDTEWSGYYNRTGKVVACMIGDDRRTAVNAARSAARTTVSSVTRSTSRLTSPEGRTRSPLQGASRDTFSDPRQPARGDWR
jgi:hypothetical protein